MCTKPEAIPLPVYSKELLMGPPDGKQKDHCRNVRLTFFSVPPGGEPGPTVGGAKR